MCIRSGVRVRWGMPLSRLAIAAFLLLSMSCLGVVGAQSTGSGPAGTYFEVEAVNPGLEGLAPGANLETPQACVEHFVLAARKDDWRRAAAALDFRLLGDVDEAGAADLAERFFFVLNQELWIDWGRLPDRPDGMSSGQSLGQPSPMSGQARRSIELGTIDLNGRDVPISVHRVKPRNGAARWLFSPHSIDNVGAMWDIHGPSWLAQQMPSWARQRWHFRIPIWQWLGTLLSLFLAPIAGFLFAKLIQRWIINRFDGIASELGKRLLWPTGATVASLIIWLMMDWVLGLPSEVATVIEPMTMILFVGMVVWLAMRTTNFFVQQVLESRIRDRHEEESASRKRLLTQVAVARHVVLLVLVLVGISIILLQLDVFRTLGVTMLTSAGALAVLLSIAGRAVIGNLIAGLQVALAQPFRIGDTVYVESNWGQIEDLTYVDVIVRTWDERRLVFPVGYFISNWFENWSKKDPYLIKASYLKVDYGADVEVIREKFLQLVQDDEDWMGDPDTPEVLVTDYGDETMTLRLTCGGADPSTAWSLACRVREQLMAWLQQVEDGRYLPRRRVLLSQAPWDAQDQSQKEAAAQQP